MKYIYTIKGNTVTAQGAYAGKDVTAKAVCADCDLFDANIGQALSKVRLDIKIQAKRVKRAIEKAKRASEAYLSAKSELKEREDYVVYAQKELENLKSLYKEFIQDI